MARARVSHESVTAEVRDGRKRENVSIFPIAIPLLTGQWYNYNCNTGYDGGRGNGIEDGGDIRYIIDLRHILSHLQIFK